MLGGELIRMNINGRYVSQDVDLTSLSGGSVKTAVKSLAAGDALQPDQAGPANGTPVQHLFRALQWFAYRSDFSQPPR